MALYTCDDLINPDDIQENECSRLFLLGCARFRGLTPDRCAVLRRIPYEKFLKTDYWRRFRIDLIASRGAYCQICRHSSMAVEPHHKTYEHRGLEYWNSNDVVLLCRTCHETHHRGYRTRPISYASVVE